MPISRNLLMDTDDLFVPDYHQNIYKVLPTALRCMGVQAPREDLFDISEVRSHLETNKALNAKRVIVCLVDSLGINNIADTAIGQLYANLSGVPLSSTFPSITSAAVTSIHMGVPPTQHGILGHRIYFPEYGTIVDTLRMAGQGVRIRDAIVTAGINVRRLLWSSPVVTLLRKQPGSPLVHADGLPTHIAGTGLGHFFTNRATILPYTDTVDAFGMTRRAIDQYPRKPLFITLYFGVIDYLAHKYGPYSPEYKEGCNAFLHQLRAFVQRLTPAEAKSTTILICSDHGQTPLREDRKILFTEEQLKEVEDTLIAPPGHSGRVMHFYCTGHRQEKRLKHWLKEHVEDRALVLDSKDISKSRLFPDPITPAIIGRLGDLLLVCRDGADTEIVRDFDRTEEPRLLPRFDLLGSHGSLTEDELYAPFLAFNAQVLR